MAAAVSSLTIWTSKCLNVIALATHPQEKGNRLFVTRIDDVKGSDANRPSDTSWNCRFNGHGLIRSEKYSFDRREKLMILVGENENSKSKY